MNQAYTSGHTGTTIQELSANAPLRAQIADAASAVRAGTPLAESLTNFVTMNFVANAQLAAGGAAAMSLVASEVTDIAAVSKALYVNVGTLLPFYEQSIPHVAQELARTGLPWVLDPVAAGLGTLRTSILTSLRNTPPSIVRSNASEIMALADMWGLQTATQDDSHGPAGVESADEVDSAIDAAMSVARHLRATRADGLGAVAVSGAVDLVTDGERVLRLTGGDPMMTKITGAGCALGGVMATYSCVAPPLVAATAASILFNQAGVIAAAQSNGPGTFQAQFLDALWHIRPQDLEHGSVLEAQ